MVAVVGGLALALAVALLPAVRRGGSSAVARALRWLALAAVVVAAAFLAASTWEDSGTFAILALGLPLLLCLAPLLVPSRLVAPVTWGAAAALLAWSVLLGLGIGLHFLPAALLQVAAAAAEPGRRQQRALA